MAITCVQQLQLQQSAGDSPFKQVEFIFFLIRTFQGRRAALLWHRTDGEPGPTVPLPQMMHCPTHCTHPQALPAVPQCCSPTRQLVQVDAVRAKRAAAVVPGEEFAPDLPAGFKQQL